MRVILPSRRARLLMVVAGCVLAAVLFFYVKDKASAPHPISSPPPLTQITPQPKQVQAVINLPVRLRIPSINIDATIEYMGLTAGGAMDTTKGPDNVGWYKLGQRPGEVGSAVITGHFGWKNHLPAAFDNLHSLHPGDVMYIEDDKGASTTFIVRELRQYGKNDDSKAVFSSSDGKAHLNLITCEGTWNAASKSYSNRLVVFTDKE